MFTLGLEERIATISAGEGVNRKRVILTSYGQEEECEIENKTKQNIKNGDFPSYKRSDPAFSLSRCSPLSRLRLPIEQLVALLV